MPTINVSKTTHDLLGARNRRDVGRGVIARPMKPDGTVDMELSDEVAARLEALRQPGETLEAAIIRVIWTSPSTRA